jgi:hypothetical protein
MERRVEPSLADWQNEYLDAVQRGRYWTSRWIQFAGMLAVLKVVALITLEQWADALLDRDAETRRALAKASVIFGTVTTSATAALAWVPFNAMPVARPVDFQELLLLIPQALPLAIPLGLTAAILFGLAGRVATRLVVGALTWAVICSVMSFLTLGWLAPASNQAYRAKVVGFEIPKGDNESSLGEIAARIGQIRAFDPSAPARRLSTLYHTRVALSATPLVLTVFSLVTIGRIGRRRAGRVSAAFLACSGFAFLFVWTAYLAFSGAVPPPVAAWMPNIIFVALTAATLRLFAPAAKDAR